MKPVWGVLLGVGLTAALAAAAMLGPPARKNQYTDADLALTVAFVSGAFALTSLLIVLLLRAPDPSSARVGETVTVIVGILCAAVLVYRLIAGTSDERGFTTADLTIWVPMMAAILLLMAGIAIRCDPVRRSPVRRS